MLQVRSDIPHEILAEKYAQPPSQFVTIGNQKVHLRDEGQGPTLLLVHGAGASLHTWEGIVTELVDSFRIITLDLPGFGLTGPQTEGNYSISRQVQLIDDIVDSLGVDNFVIGGNSMGGLIAWRYAVEHQERLDGLILIDAVGYPKAGWPYIFGFARLPGVSLIFKSMLPRWYVRGALKRAYGKNRKVTKANVTRYYELNRHEGNRSAGMEIMSGVMEDYTDKIQDIEIPALILWGKKDKIIDIKNAENFAADLPNSISVVYEKEGHIPMEESPELTAIDMREFLKGLYRE